MSTAASYTLPPIIKTSTFIHKATTGVVGCVLVEAVSKSWKTNAFKITRCFYLIDSPVVECWLQVREVLGSIPSQGPRHTKDVMKMVPVVPLFSTEHSRGKILALSQELR